MKAYKQKEIKYYKYVIADWTQPVLTSNYSDPDFIVSSPNDPEDAYKLFDGDASTGAQPHTSAGSFSGKNYYFEMKSANGLNITNIAVTNRDTGDGYKQAITSGSIQVSNDGVEWQKIKDWTNSNKDAGAIWNISVSYEGYYKYIRLYITAGSSDNAYNNIRVNGLTLTATQQLSLETTEDDYDYFVENKRIFLPAKLIRNHYKYQEQTFVRPNLTADGIMGGDSFAVRGTNGNQAYNAYDGNASTHVSLATTGVIEHYFYNPNPLKISSLGFTYYPSCWIKSGEIYGSNNDSDYVLLTTFSHSSNSGTVEINNEIPYKYFKLKVLSANGSDGYNPVIANIYELTFDAIEIISIKSTEDDCDFYEDKYIYYGITG